MNQRLKLALPFLCLTIISCAHLSEMPTQNDIGIQPEASFGRAPTEEEATNGLKRQLRTVTAKYIWPPMKICWGNSKQWKRNGQYWCGWGLKTQPEGFGPQLVLFQAMNSFGLIPGIPALGQPTAWQQGPGNQEKWFAVSAQSPISNERLSELVIDQAEYDKRILSKKLEEEREATLTTGAEICKRIGLEPACYEALSLDEFSKEFGKNMSRSDKVAFHNAHRASEQKRQEREAAERQRNQPIQVIYPNNSQQQMMNFLLLNQMQRSFQPQNTNCTTLGSNTNCTTY